MKSIVNKDKYLSVLVVLVLLLIASYDVKSPLIITFKLLLYLAIGKLIIKFALVVQGMISDIKSLIS